MRTRERGKNGIKPQKSKLIQSSGAVSWERRFAVLTDLSMCYNRHKANSLAKFFQGP